MNISMLRFRRTILRNELQSFHGRSSRRRRWMPWCATFFLLMCACSEPTPVGEQSSALIGGLPDLGGSATVLISTPQMNPQGFCSGVRVGLHHVLTAAHCVDQ